MANPVYDGNSKEEENGVTLSGIEEDANSVESSDNRGAEAHSDSAEKITTKSNIAEDPEEETSNTEDSIMETPESQDVVESPGKASPSSSDSESDTSEVPTKRKKRNTGASEARHHQTLRKTLDPFVQKKDCNKLRYNVGKCLECKQKNSRQGRKGNLCRFFLFRKLRYTERGSMTVAGFPNSECHSDYTEEDFNIWRPCNPPEGMSVDLAKFLLQEVGDQFCELVKHEKMTLIQLKDQENNMLIWRRVVENLREMCDVCSTTLFNYHWTCSKCGFVVCVSCFMARKNGSAQVLPLPPTSAVSTSEFNPKDRYGWLTCHRRIGEHVLEQLMLTQIVTGKLLDDLWTKLHKLRRRLNIPENCSCEKPLSVDETSSSDIACKTLAVGTGKESGNGLTAAATKCSDDSDASDDDAIDADEFLDLMGGGGGDDQLAESEEHHEGDSANTSDLTKKNNDCEEEEDANSDSLNRSKDSIPNANLSDPSLSDSKVPDGGELKNFKRIGGSNAYSIKVVPKEVMAYGKTSREYPNVPHAWLCNGYLLRLTDPLNSGNLKMFQEQWKRGQPVIVSNVGTKLDQDLWAPESFSRDFGQQFSNFINCMTGKVVPNQKMKKFWDGFEHMKQRLKDDNGEPMLLKLKDWPPADDFAKVLPRRFKDLMSALPLGEYTHRDGKLNLAARLPNIFCKPDLGPKMYIAYGSGLHLDKGTTNLHLDVSDAANVMVHVGVVKDEDNTKHNEAVMKAIKESDCDVPTITRVVGKDKELPGALWHIWEAKDADKIRDMINKVALERGLKVERHHDAIHDQSWYLDSELRKRLRTEYNVVGYPILQCQGDAVFIPAGAPHQVRNLNNCIKIAEDFVSPENVGHCFYLTEEFRNLTETHTNHEDKLQIKNIVYHTVKDAVAVIDEHLNKQESV